MANKFKIGDHVRIMSGGLAELHNSTGEVVDDRDRDGRTVMYRVELDAPVFLPGCGSVSDDLWAGEHLSLVCRQCRVDVRRCGRVANGIWPLRGVTGCSWCQPRLLVPESAQAEWDRVHGSQYDAESAAQAEFASFERMGQRMSAGLSGGDPDDSFDELSSPAGLASHAPVPRGWDVAETSVDPNEAANEGGLPL